jgi:hypothetical protein
MYAYAYLPTCLYDK